MQPTRARRPATPRCVLLCVLPWVWPWLWPCVWVWLWLWLCGGVAVCGCVRVCGCVMLYCVWGRCVVVGHLAVTLTASAPPRTHQPHSPQDSNQPPSIARTQSNASGSTLPSIDPVPDMSVGRGWARFDLRAEVLGEADTLRSRAALRTRTLERMRAVLLRRPRRQLLSAPVAADSVSGGAGVDAGAGVGAGVGVGAGIDEDGAAFSSDDSSMSEVSHASSLASRSSAEEDGPSKAKRQLRRVAFSVREPLTDLMIAERWAKLAVECVSRWLACLVGPLTSRVPLHVACGVWACGAVVRCVLLSRATRGLTSACQAGGIDGVLLSDAKAIAHVRRLCCCCWHVFGCGCGCVAVWLWLWLCGCVSLVSRVSVAPVPVCHAQPP